MTPQTKLTRTQRYEWNRNFFLFIALIALGVMLSISLLAAVIYVIGWGLGACFMSASYRAKGL